MAADGALLSPCRSHPEPEPQVSRQPSPSSPQQTPNPGCRRDERPRGPLSLHSERPAPFSGGLTSRAGKSPQRRWNRATSCESRRLRSSSAMVSRDPVPPTCSHARPCPRRAPWPRVPQPDAPSAGRAGRGSRQQVRRPGPSARPALEQAQVLATTLRTSPPAS